MFVYTHLHPLPNKVYTEWLSNNLGPVGENWKWAIFVSEESDRDHKRRIVGIEITNDVDALAFKLKFGL